MTFLVDYKLTSYLPHDWLWDISGHGSFSCRRLGKRITRVWQTEHVNCVVPAKPAFLILNDIRCIKFFLSQFQHTICIWLILQTFLTSSPFCGFDFSLHLTGEINGSYLFWNPQWGLRDVASQLNEGHPSGIGGALEVTKQLSGKDRENLGKNGKKGENRQKKTCLVSWSLGSQFHRKLADWQDNLACSRWRWKMRHAMQQ